MQILFIQTADSGRYSNLLEITSRTVLRYIGLHGGDYQSFVGIKRGYHAWQATYNRIPMLASILRDGFDGWVFYLDADAYINDLTFNISSYLKNKEDIAFIAAPSGIQPPSWWNVNAGVFGVNLGHSRGKEIILSWNEAFSKISDDDLRKAIVWDQVTNDQNLLHGVLKSAQETERYCLVDTSVQQILNSGGARFIRQVLRATSDFRGRIEILEKAVVEVLQSEKAAKDLLHTDVLLLQQEFTTALYQALLLRNPDQGGLASGIARLRDGSRSLTDEIRSCLSSREFREKLSLFLDCYVDKQTISEYVRNMYLAETHSKESASGN